MASFRFKTENVCLPAVCWRKVVENGKTGRSVAFFVLKEDKRTLFVDYLAQCREFFARSRTSTLRKCFVIVLLLQQLVWQTACLIYAENKVKLNNRNITAKI